MKLSFAFLFLPVVFLPVVASAGIWPDAIGPFHRTSAAPARISDKPVWDEYGLKDSETATYENGKVRFTATAYHLQDSTSCMGAFDWQRPPQSTPAKAANLAAETADSLLLVHGSYLLSFEGHKPTTEELGAAIQSLLNVDTTSLPALPGFLPSQNLVANSERYIIGPAGLEKFAPGIPPSVAGFHFGAEAQTGTFHGPKGDITLAIFNYPTPQIAMQKAGEFEKLAGAMVKRSGPLVAVAQSAGDADFAEKLLSGVRYRAAVTRDEYVPTRRDNIGNLLLNAFILIGILLAFSVVSGLALGGYRALARRGRKGEEADALISLHLGQ